MFKLCILLLAWHCSWMHSTGLLLLILMFSLALLHSSCFWSPTYISPLPLAHHQLCSMLLARKKKTLEFLCRRLCILKMTPASMPPTTRMPHSCWNPLPTLLQRRRAWANTQILNPLYPQNALYTLLRNLNTHHWGEWNKIRESINE